MKRIGYLHEQVYDIENIEIADDKARRKKSNISRFYNKYIHIVVSYSKCFRVNFVYNNKSYYFESKSRNLFYSLTRYSFPVNFKIRPYVRTKKNRNGCAARLNREIR